MLNFTTVTTMLVNMHDELIMCVQNQVDVFVAFPKFHFEGVVKILLDQI